MDGLVGEVEHLIDTLSDGRHDGVVEQSVQQTQQKGTDDDRDKDLDAGVYIAFGFDVGDRSHGTGGQGVYLIADGVKQFLHKKLPLSLNFDFDF